MRKLLVVALVGTLVMALLGPAEAKRRKKKKPKAPAPVSLDQSFFMRRTACDTAPESTQLSLQDGPDTACWWSDAGVAYEALWQVSPEAGEVLWVGYGAIDGIPLTLDASRPITGEITLYGGDCIQDPACSPAGIAAGQATFRVKLLGTAGGEDTLIGEYEESFLATPGGTHTIKVEIAPDAALDKTTFDSLTFKTFHGGIAYGPGGTSYDDPASFIVIPSWITPVPR